MYLTTVRSVAIFSGYITWLFLHRRSIRGDIAILSEFCLFTAIVLLLRLEEFDRPTHGAFEWILLHLTTLTLTTALYRISPFHPLAHFPGPVINKLTSLRMAQIVLSGRRHLEIQKMHKKYGKIVRLGPNNISINSRTAVGPIYSNSNAMDRSDAYSLRSLPGDGLFFLLGIKAHNRRRDMWAKGFTNSALEAYQPILETRTLELIDCIQQRTQPDGTVDLSACLEYWSYDVMGDIVYGKSSELELMKNGDPQKFVKGGKYATAAFDCLGEVPWLFDILWYFPVTRSIRSLQDLAARLILRRKDFDNYDDDTDIAKHLFGVDETTRKELTSDELTMDSIFAIQAGSDTSANVLQYMFFFITAHPESLRKLQVELDQWFPNHEMSLDFNILANLPYLNAVVYESLRLGTPLSGLPRVVPDGGTILEGVFIPQGTVVSVPNYTQQLDPSNFYPRPTEFLPERWLPEGLGPGSRIEPSAIMSFSFGPFGCLGRTLALQEMRIVLARLTLSFDLAFQKGFNPGEYQKNIRNIRTTFFPNPLMVIPSRSDV